MHVADSLIEWVLPPDAVLQRLARRSLLGFRLYLGADPVWEAFLERLCASEFKELHPDLRGKTPADLRRRLPLM
eukprot:1842574-Lingulodinium_polyedra.AAC.1